MARPDEISPLIGMLITAFPNSNISKEELKETIKTYIMFLGDIDYPILNEAVAMCIKTNTFFPSIGEIRRNATEIIMRRSGLKPPEMAWEEVLQNIRNVGRNGVPYWSSETIHRAVRSLGWWDICASENIGVTRAAFIKLYTEIFENLRNEVQSNANALPGGDNGTRAKALACRFNQDGTPQTSQSVGVANAEDNTGSLPELRRL